MNKKTLSYLGYTGSVEVSVEDDCLFGKILFIDDLIVYEGETPGKLEAAFKEAVDRYIAYCKSKGKNPNKPYSGSFNVRIGEERHRAASIAAAENGQNLNDFVSTAIDEKLNQRQPKIQIRTAYKNQSHTQSSYNEDIAYQWRDQSQNQLRH